MRAGAGESPITELGLSFRPDDLAVDVADCELLAGWDVADRDGGVREIGDAVMKALGCEICVLFSKREELTLGGSRG